VERAVVVREFQFGVREFITAFWPLESSLDNTEGPCEQKEARDESFFANPQRRKRKRGKTEYFGRGVEPILILSSFAPLRLGAFAKIPNRENCPSSIDPFRFNVTRHCHPSDGEPRNTDLTPRWPQASAWKYTTASRKDDVRQIESRWPSKQ
jgi:hypothetical protein